MRNIYQASTNSNPQFFDTTKPATNGKPCSCDARAIIACECTHRQSFRQRARLVWLMRRETWPSVDQALRDWHANRQALGLARRGELERALPDARRLFWQYRQTDLSAPDQADRLVWQNLSGAESWRLLLIAGRAHVGSRYHFLVTTFRLLRLYQSLRCTQWAGVREKMPISWQLLTKSLGLGWMRAGLYLREWRRLKIVKIVRPATKENRQAGLCRLCEVTFNFDSDLAADAGGAAGITGGGAYKAVDDFIVDLLRGNFQPNGRRVSLYRLIKILGDSRKSRGIFKAVKPWFRSKTKPCSK